MKCIVLKITNTIDVLVPKCYEICSYYSVRRSIKIQAIPYTCDFHRNLKLFRCSKLKFDIVPKLV